MKNLLKLLLTVPVLYAEVPEWINTENAPATIFFQGNANSQIQLANYTREFITTTGQHITCPPHQRIDIVYQSFIGKELDEVIPLSATNNIVEKTYGALSALIQHYVYHYKVSKADEENIAGHSINIKKLNLGQQGDVLEHKAKYDLFKTTYPTRNFILFGISRGAATTFNAEALYKYPAKILVLEGCFTSVGDVLTKRYGRLRSYIEKILEKLTSYSRTGYSPISLVDKFPANIPVVFISSMLDKEVPYELTHKLAHTLAARKKNDVYLITLKHSSHSGYALDHEEDRNYYQTCIHAIYKKYNLPYIEHYAEAGEKYLQEMLISSV